MAIGLVIGAALPFVAQSLVAEILPVRARVALYARPLAIAGGFGLLVSLMFALVMGLAGGFLPAVRAARLNIVESLRTA